MKSPDGAFMKRGCAAQLTKKDAYVASFRKGVRKEFSNSQS
jgi:hypothetical protein